MFTQPNYLHNFVQSTFNALGAEKVRGKDSVIYAENGCVSAGVHNNNDNVQLIIYSISTDTYNINFDFLLLCFSMSDSTSDIPGIMCFLNFMKVCTTLVKDALKYLHSYSLGSYWELSTEKTN